MGFNDSGSEVSGFLSVVRNASGSKQVPSLAGLISKSGPISLGPGSLRTQSAPWDKSNVYYLRADKMDEQTVEISCPPCMIVDLAEECSIGTVFCCTEGGIPLQTRTLTPELGYRRAKSVPTYESYRLVKFGGRRKKIRPKSRDAFTKGPIFRWEDSAFAKRAPNKTKTKKNSCLNVSTDSEEITTNKIFSDSKEFKVYSRNRTRHCPTKNLVPNLECNQLDVFNEDLELETDGDKQLIHRPDSSSLSSSSDSEEMYFSDRETEDDLDL